MLPTVATRQIEKKTASRSLDLLCLVVLLGTLAYGLITQVDAALNAQQPDYFAAPPAAY